MTKGQTLALTSPKGIHIFKMIEFQSYKVQKEVEHNNTTQLKEKQNGKEKGN